jgi:phosphoserine phosphatase RsbU/P
MATGEEYADFPEDHFEDAPCGYLTTLLDGTIVRVNRTFEQWTGHAREQLLAGMRFQDLLSPGGQIYHETHYAPLLQMQGWVRAIAVEIVRADGSRLSALVNAVVQDRGPGNERIVRTTIFDATDRRRYEEELLRARRREREIVEQLQASLMPGDAPQAPGLEIEAYYRPAVAGLDVGGDWYDAFWLDEGRRIGFVIGDVVGHGIHAAATMGQLRSAIRALATTGLPPGPLLDALDGYSRRHRVGEAATLICAELDLDSAQLCMSCAGHLPPVLVAPGEDACLLWEGRSLPLGVRVHEGEPRPQTSLTLSAGSSLLLYTDGLVERREQSIMQGLDGLVEQAGRHRASSAATLAGAVVDALAGVVHSDDVCLLVVRLAGAAQPV